MLFAGLRLIADDIGIRDRCIAFVDDKGDIEGGFEGWFVKAGECATSVRRLKLSYGVVTLRGLREIEPAQLVIQNAGVAQLKPEFACGKLLPEIEGGLLFAGIFRDLGGQRPAVNGRRDALEFDFRGVQDDRVHWFVDNDVDRFTTGESRGSQVGRQGKRIVLRLDSLRKALCACAEAVRKGDGNEGNRKTDFGKAGKQIAHFYPFTTHSYFCMQVR